MWIVFPILVGIVLYFLRRWDKAVLAAGLLVSLALAGLARWMPITDTVRLGPLSFELQDTLEVFGRRFLLDENSRPVLVFAYLSTAAWFAGSRAARVSRMWIPLGLVMAALFVAALAVEPFLYAALLIEMAVLVSIPLLSPPGHPVGRGVLRYLAFQTLGMPFLLFAGWMIEGAGGAPVSPALIPRAAVLLGLGFALLSAIFPFHTWAPMLAKESHPYTAAFVFFLLTGSAALFGLEFFTRYSWLQSTPLVVSVLRFMGALMVGLGGIAAAFQRNLGRILGMALLKEVGLSLLALSLVAGQVGNGLEIFLALLIPRGVALLLWSLALSLMKAQTQELYYRDVAGLGRQLPAATTGLFLGQLSLAGFPLLAGFPVQIALWTALASQSLPVVLLALLGSAGLLISAIRTLAVLITGPGEEPWSLGESNQQLGLLLAGTVFTLLLGLRPQWLLLSLMHLAQQLAGLMH